MDVRELASRLRSAGPQYRLMTRGAARLLGFAESEAQIDGVHVPFLVRGWGVPIVLIHGFGADKESWLPLAAALRAKGRSLIIPDLPGFGAAGDIPPERAAAKCAGADRSPGSSIGWGTGAPTSWGARWGAGSRSASPTTTPSARRRCRSSAP